LQKEQYHIRPAKHSRERVETRATLDGVLRWQTPTWHSDRQTDDLPAATHVPAELQTYTMETPTGHAEICYCGNLSDLPGYWSHINDSDGQILIMIGI